MMSDLKDSNGTPYSTPDGKPAQGGTSVTIHSPNGHDGGRIRDPE